jgi:hypothetical protein
MPPMCSGYGWPFYILFSGAADQATTGELRFLKQDGTALDLNVN